MTDRKLLFVDDEPNILQGYQRQLRKQFSVETALGGPAGLDMMRDRGPFAVVVTDMRMPTMSGVEFLRTVKTRWPETVRLMLTGNADQQTAIDAVNEGSVFRFLNKPCPAETMTAALTAALEQHALLTAEKELLSRTLGGSVNLLADVLSLLNPGAFGRTAKIRRLCSQLCEKLAVMNAWEVTVASTLALVGYIAVPERILSRFEQQQLLTAEEKSQLEGHAEIGARLIGRIPRLERVAEIIRCQNEPYRITASAGADERTGMAANILKAVIDFEGLVSRGLPHAQAIQQMSLASGVYRPQILQALSELEPSTQSPIREVRIMELRDGMILEEHLVSKMGDLLLARGTEINATLRERLMSLLYTAKGIKEPVRVC